MGNEQIKALIELSSTFEEADSVISKFTSLNTYAQKIAYLQELFDCEIVNRKIFDKDDYTALLTAIVTKR